MLKLVLPLVALLAVGGSAAGGSVYLLTRDQAVEEVLPPAAQATATATAEEPSATPTSGVTPTARPGWLTYTDPDFRFSISYPPEFIIEDLGAKGGLPSGFLKLLRAVDKLYTEGYPPGQVGIGVAAKDAATTQEWVSKHSEDGESLEPDYPAVSNAAATAIGGRDAMSFDWHPREGGVVVHSVIFFSGSYAIEFHWYASDPAYESAIRSVFDEILKSYAD